MCPTPGTAKPPSVELAVRDVIRFGAHEWSTARSTAGSPATSHGRPSASVAPLDAAG
jgi:hypothetical protein